MRTMEIMEIAPGMMIIEDSFSANLADDVDFIPCTYIESVRKEPCEPIVATALEFINSVFLLHDAKHFWLGSGRGPGTSRPPAYRDITTDYAMGSPRMHGTNE